MPAPRKATGPTKKAAAKVVDFDAKRKAKKVARRTGKIRYGGRVWDLKEPNVAVVGELEAQDTIATLPLAVAANVVADQREDFLKALAADEDLTFEVLNDLQDEMLQVVYGDIPSDPA